MEHSAHIASDHRTNLQIDDKPAARKRLCRPSPRLAADDVVCWGKRLRAGLLERGELTWSTMNDSGRTRVDVLSDARVADVDEAGGRGIGPQHLAVRRDLICRRYDKSAG